ncbi:MAG: phosphonate ABC transporter, permease protein PhnE, partial [Paracoccaceae bacterium]|nr:phosphonate ABC transporter, permease protein PhnE [Paracoccaceae bacterium]
MVEVSIWPEPEQRALLVKDRAAYLHLVRRKRMYGGILLALFIALMAAGFRTAESRNAGGFLNGLSQLNDFPAEVLAEAWDKRANLPGLFWQFLPSLIETVNIAAVATLLG